MSLVCAGPPHTAGKLLARGRVRFVAWFLYWFPHPGHRKGLSGGNETQFRSFISLHALAYVHRRWSALACVPRVYRVGTACRPPSAVPFSYP